MTITEFIEARIAEDEATARDWQHMARFGGEKVVIRGGGTGYHALINPDRVLAQCEAMRRIVELHDGGRIKVAPGWFEQLTHECEGSHGLTDCGTLRALAAIWSDHPDYDEAWRP